jgi:hypothetical protein
MLLASCHSSLRRLSRRLCSAAAVPCDEQALRALQTKLVDELPLSPRAQVALAGTEFHAKTKWEVPGHPPRIVTDGIADEDECLLLEHSTRTALASGITEGGGASRMLPCMSDYSEELLGVIAHQKAQYLIGKIREEIETDYGVAVETAGALLQWRCGPNEGTNVYEFSHVDKANRLQYDFSAVLYLSTSGVDFTGGSFAFNDEGEDRLVPPVAGRLVTFSSGAENVHQARAVESGERFNLAAWYTVVDQSD